MPKKVKERPYSDETLIEAISCIKNSTLTYRAASVKYNIPIATLCDKVKQRGPIGSGKTDELNM